jgi:hypothetical protein
MCSAISSRFFDFRPLLAVEVRLLPVHGGPSSFSVCSRGTVWHREIYEPSLPEEFALPGHFEALGGCAARERHDGLHTGMPPERDWDCILSLARSE